MLRDSLIEVENEEEATDLSIVNGDSGVKAMGESIDTSKWDLNRVNIVYDRRWNTGSSA